MKRLMVLLSLWLILVGTAWADRVNVIIDLDTKTVTVTNSIAIRETVPIRFINIGDTHPTNIVVRVLDAHDTNLLAFAEEFSGENGYAVGDIDLNTTELVDLFAGFPHQAPRLVSWGVWDMGRNRLLVNQLIPVHNNPYLAGMPAPNPVPPSSIYQRLAALEHILSDWDGDAVPIGSMALEDRADFYSIAEADAEFLKIGEATYFEPVDLATDYGPDWDYLTSSISATLFMPVDLATDYGPDWEHLTSSIAAGVFGPDDLATDYGPDWTHLTSSIAARASGDMYQEDGSTARVVAAAIALGDLELRSSSLWYEGDQIMTFDGVPSLLRDSEALGDFSVRSNFFAGSLTVGGSPIDFGAFAQSNWVAQALDEINVGGGWTQLVPRVETLEDHSIAPIQTNLNFVSGEYQHQTNISGRIIPGGGWWTGSIGSGFHGFRYREVAPPPSVGQGPVMAPVVEQVWKAGHDYGRSFIRLAQLDETQRVNETTEGQETDMTGFTQVTTNIWRIVVGPGSFIRGWEVKGQSVSGGVAKLGVGDWIRQSTFGPNTGVSEILMTTTGHPNNVYFEVQISTNNFSSWTTNGLFYPITGQKSGYTLTETHPDTAVRVVFGGFFTAALPDQELAVDVLDFQVRRWSISDHVGHINDAAGIITLVDDARHGADPRVAINQRSLDLHRNAVDNEIARIDPARSGIRLDSNPLRFGNRWVQREDAEHLITSYMGQDVMWISNGGTTFPNTVFFAAEFTNLTVRVVANDNAEPMMQYSTNIVADAWNWVTNYTTSWPAISNGTATITFPIDQYPASTMFRVAVTTAVETATAAHWVVPFEMYGHEIRGGVFIGQGEGLRSLTGDDTGVWQYTGGVATVAADELRIPGALATDDIVLGAETSWQGASHKLVFNQYSVGDNMGYTNTFWFRNGVPYIGPNDESNRVMVASDVDEKIAAIPAADFDSVHSVAVTNLHPSVWSNVPIVEVGPNADTRTGLRLDTGLDVGGHVDSRHIDFITRHAGVLATNSLYSRGGVTGHSLRYIVRAPFASPEEFTILHTGIFNPNSYLTVSQYNNATTNSMRVFQGAPTSNTMHGTQRDVWVDRHNTNVYFYAPDPGGTSLWMRVEGVQM